MAGLTNFKDCAALLASALKMATGKEQETALNTAEFVSQATTAIEIGVDPIMKALSQMVSRTIFSARPYTGKFRGIMRDAQAWGNHVRKINYMDSDPETDERGMVTHPTPGESLTPWKWQPSNVLQTNFYGGRVYQRSMMLTRDQIYSAFRSPEEFGSFVSGLMVNYNSQIEQDREAMARICVSNYIAGKVKADTSNVIHLLTEYKAETGLADLTAETIMQPDNFRGFVSWLAARIEDLSNLLTNRSINFHLNVADKEISRHTPKENQRMLMHSPILTRINTIARANTYHDNLLSMDVTEAVNYWQAIDTPDTIMATPNYIDSTGTIVTADAAVTVDKIVGVLFDVETMGETVIGEWSGTTPLDPRHGITNIYNHYTIRFWNDFTENGIVLLLD